MKPLIGLNPLTIKQCTDFEEKIDIAARAGYDGIGLRGDEIEAYLNDGHTLEDIKKLVEDRELAITDIGSIAGWQFTDNPPLVCRISLDSPADDEKLRDELKLLFARAKKLGCQYIPAISAIEEEGDFERGVEDFAGVCDMAAEYDLKIAFEFVGFSKQMNNLQITAELINQADRDNGGLLFDTFHYHRGNCKIDNLDRIKDEKLFMVHINDVMDMPLSKIEDQHRLYPGLGVVDYPPVLKKLDEKNYSGFYSIEIFNEEYWQSDPYQVALKARKATENKLKDIL